jgi:hypothetical protein
MPTAHTYLRASTAEQRKYGRGRAANSDREILQAGDFNIAQTIRL